MLTRVLIFTIAIIFNSSAFAKPKTIVQTYYQTHNAQKAITTDGFMMDGFENIGKYSFCYSGDKLDVCEIVNDGYSESLKEFHSGGHELMQIFSCTVHLYNGDYVSVDVLLSNDYSEAQRAEIEITQCKK